MRVNPPQLNRRAFIATTTAAAIAPSIARADTASETYVAGILAKANALANDDEATRLAGIEALVDEYVDMKRVSRFVLGQYARAMTDAQKSVYRPLFRRFATNIYQNVLAGYAGETLSVTNSVDRSARDSIVNSKVDGGGANGRYANLVVHWRVYRSREGALSVVDAGADGVWLAIEQQSQFKSVIANNGGGERGIDALIESLEEQIGAA